MDVFLAVLKDLWQFASGRPVAPPLALPSSQDISLPKRPEATEVKAAPAAQSAVTAFPVTELFSTVYIRENDAPLFARPVLTYDGVLERLRYGTPLQLIRYEGRYAQVQFSSKTAWVLKDALTSRKEDIYPEFTDGTVYDAYAAETVQVRTFLRDEFSAQALSLPLQAGEYVSYEWQRAQRVLPWGQERPRLPGRWQQLLRGHRELVFGITPKTGAIMEYVDEEGIGQLAYVTAVYPDGSVRVSGVDGAGEGRFSERMLLNDQWKEFRPVWITTA